MRRDYIRDGDAIYARSFAIIRAEADLARFSPEEAEVAVRMIHACGLVEAAAQFRFAPGFVEAARAALEAGAPILCDAGDGGAWRDAGAAAGGKRGRLHAARSADAGARGGARDHALGGGARALARPAGRARWWRSATRRPRCSTCSRCSRAGAPRPAAIIGMPVGFVGAAEFEGGAGGDRPRVPYAIVRGRMGGSAMAAAAVNALARAGL